MQLVDIVIEKLFDDAKNLRDVIIAIENLKQTHPIDDILNQHSRYLKRIISELFPNKYIQRSDLSDNEWYDYIKDLSMGLMYKYKIKILTNQTIIERTNKIYEASPCYLSPKSDHLLSFDLTFKVHGSRPKLGTVGYLIEISDCGEHHIFLNHKHIVLFEEHNDENYNIAKNHAAKLLYSDYIESQEGTILDINCRLGNVEGVPKEADFRIILENNNRFEFRFLYEAYHSPVSFMIYKIIIGI